MIISQVARGLLGSCANWDDGLPIQTPPFGSLQICGAPGDRSCAESLCGGALCRDSVGMRHCGGVGCTGALPVSAQALSSARNASQQLEVALGQLSAVAQKVGMASPCAGFSCEALCAHLNITPVPTSGSVPAPCTSQL